jgi:hypothetical protein
MAWWKDAGISPKATARSLWLKSHPLSGNSADSCRKPAPIKIVTVATSSDGRSGANTDTNPIISSPSR